MKLVPVVDDFTRSDFLLDDSVEAELKPLPFSTPEKVYDDVLLDDSVEAELKHRRPLGRVRQPRRFSSTTASRPN